MVLGRAAKACARPFPEVGGPRGRAAGYNDWCSQRRVEEQDFLLFYYLHEQSKLRARHQPEHQASALPSSAQRRHEPLGQLQQRCVAAGRAHQAEADGAAAHARDW